jgi:hypothetical protein
MATFCHGTELQTISLDAPAQPVRLAERVYDHDRTEQEHQSEVNRSLLFGTALLHGSLTSGKVSGACCVIGGRQTRAGATTRE